MLPRIVYEIKSAAIFQFYRVRERVKTHRCANITFHGNGTFAFATQLKHAALNGMQSVGLDAGSSEQVVVKQPCGSRHRVALAC